jgi:phosphoenolpyruvate carboxykinase (GTP)
VLAWILDRCAGNVGALDTPIGNMPRPGDINTAGLDISPEALAELTAVPNAAWRKEIAGFRQYLLEYGSHLPGAMLAEADEVARRLEAAG